MFSLSLVLRENFPSVITGLDSQHQTQLFLYPSASPFNMSLTTAYVSLDLKKSTFNLDRTRTKPRGTKINATGLKCNQIIKFETVIYSDGKA